MEGAKTGIGGKSTTEKDTFSRFSLAFFRIFVYDRRGYYRFCDAKRKGRYPVFPFSEVKKNFGFGCMRLPMKDGEVDLTEFSRMVDEFLDAGFNYFDTAHGYLGGKSEVALRHALVGRYPRDRFLLADKLTSTYFNTEQEVRTFFAKQLEICGVDYFDFYLMHAQSKQNFPKFKKCRAYEQAFELKAEGKIRHVGLSFHDSPDVLDEILTTYPAVEFVQLQLNYLDWDDATVQSRRCYEVAKKHKKPIIVMEPVKGGTLVNLPADAKKVLTDLHGGSVASYAIRFAADHDQVFMVLSGMSNDVQMRDNLSYMKDFSPLTPEERAAIGKVRDFLTSLHAVPCTACRYCTDGCPRHIPIPDIFSCLNAKNIFGDPRVSADYAQICSESGARAIDCIACGKCEKVCPQHLPIRELLRAAAREFD